MPGATPDLVEVHDVNPVDYLVVGHVTRDLQPGGGYTVGGTASYASLTGAALRRLVGVLTSVSDNVDLSVFDGSVALVAARAPETTTFRNVYAEGGRRQVLYGVADLLTPSLVPASWRSPSVVHLGPIMNQCDPSLVTSFADGTFVGITPQGWLRTTNGDGEVVPQAWECADQLLTRASAVVLSIDDVHGDWDLVATYASRTPVLAVTTGWTGGVVFVDGERQAFPAPDIAEVDPTGAGDIFAAAFFDALVRGAGPMDAAAFAACVASQSVTRPGLAGVPTPDEVAACRRGRWLTAEE